MLIKSQRKITRMALENASYPLKDETIQRALAVDIINQMPLELLHKLFKFRKWDPQSENSAKIMRDQNYSEWDKALVSQLHYEKCVLHEAEIFIDEKI